jgi:hypothetical protein
MRPSSVAIARAADQRVDWVHNIPLIAMHLIPLFAFAPGATRFAAPATSRRTRAVS